MRPALRAAGGGASFLLGPRRGLGALHEHDGAASSTGALKPRFACPPSGARPDSREGARRAPRRPWCALTQPSSGGAWHAPCAGGLRPAARRTEDTMKSPSKQSPQQLLRLHANAASMRHAPTASERALWQRLKGRQLGVQFRRKVVWGSFILDFFASSVRLVVKLTAGITLAGAGLTRAGMRSFAGLGSPSSGCRRTW
jgi:hypothetical protein